MVTGKITKVPDSVCIGPPECPQLWHDECHAYLVPVTKEETAKRIVLNHKGSFTNCYFRPPMIGEKYIEYGTTEIKTKSSASNGFHVRYIDLETGRTEEKDITEREQYNLYKAQREGKVSIIEIHRIP